MTHSAPCGQRYAVPVHVAADILVATAPNTFRCHAPTSQVAMDDMALLSRIVSELLTGMARPLR